MNEVRDKCGPPPDAQVRAGFGELYEEWGPVVEAAARPYLRCAADAEDAKQRVFTRLWKSGGWMDIESPRAYFRAAGIREARSMGRAWARRDSQQERAAEILARPARNPEEEVTARERRALAARLLDRLPPRCGRVMRLILFHDLPHSAVADRLGIRIGGVEK